MKILSEMIETCATFHDKNQIFVPLTQRSITYGETLWQGLRWATFFKTEYPNQSHVPVVSDFQPECYPIFLGAWLAGKCVVPIALTFADRDLIEVMRLSQKGVLFIRYPALTRVLPHLDNYDGKVIVFDTAYEKLPDHPKLFKFQNFAAQFQPLESIAEPPMDKDAYVLFSSGSTGRPKGVRQNWRNLIAQRELLLKRAHQTNPEICFPAVLGPRKAMVLLSAGQTVGSYHIFSSFLAGSTLFPMGGMTPLEILQNIEKLRPDSYFSLSPNMNLIMKEMANFKGDVSSVKVWVTGGAPWAADKKAQFQRTFPGTVMFGYGMTESMMIIAIEDGLSESRKGSVGRPLDGIEVEIRGPKDEKLPIGEIGEVIYRSKAVSPGYLNLPEDTKATFRHGWVYSGDLGYLDKDNYLYLVERKKRIILVQGLIVYPSRVEEAMMNLGLFNEVAVFGVSDEITGEAVVVFYSPQKPIAPDAILKKLDGVLRTYEMPKHLFEVQALPRTPATKIDYTAMVETFTKLRKESA
jgi:acyl-CoA synthetase (AMP-forming)/AMP-acid ligase II